MTIEEKAKAYDNVVNKLRRFMEHGIDPLITRTDVQDFFPELAESEDERIRKSIIAIINNYVDNSNTFKPKMIAWLERQGKSKWNENDEHHWMMCVACVEECATQEREDFSKTIDWLKSLKQRMEEQ